MSNGEGCSPMEILISKHKKEKKEMQAKILNMKKTAKCGNKKQQKETAEEMIRIEKELEDRHEREINECQELGNNDVTAPSIDKEEKEVEEVSFYKENKIKGKTQKRQEKKAEEKRRQLEAAAIDEEAAKTSLRTTEMNAVIECLLSRSLVLVDIPPDGDCLFHAIAHQLTINGKECKGIDLRRRASSYIRSHKDDFLPFLSSEDGDILDEIQFEEYCVKVEREASNGGQWGGEPELRALAETLERKIEVIQPDGRIITFGDIYNGRSLIITYHRHAYDLGEHYNSTVAISV